MTEAKIGRTILWAVDPFANESKLQRSAAWAIKALTKNLAANVQPVYLFFGNLAPLEGSFQMPEDFESSIRKEAEEELSRILNRVKIQNLKPLKVISEPFLQMREGADILVKYAKEIEAEFIVASTHAKNGIRRFFTGSFVETLMLRSDVPVIVVNPDWNRTADLKNIIFPTDFSTESREAYNKILDFAKRAGSQITLFHKITSYPFPDFDLALGAYPKYLQIIQEETTTMRRHAEQWTLDAKSKGIQAAAVIDDKLSGSPSNGILALAKRKSGIIAMASHSGPLASIFLGSTVRQVVRNSKYPVWVIHPKAKTQGQEQKVIPVKRKGDYSISEDEIMEDLVIHRRKA
jgi:nucleotide-binding universal stress UspA family protein